MSLLGFSAHDPVLQLWLSWRPADWFRVTGGRINTLVGTDRMLLTDMLVGETYAHAGLATPLFDSGVKVDLEVLDLASVSVGVIAGNVFKLLQGPRPDVFGRCRFWLDRLTADVYWQGGVQPSLRWWHDGGVAARLNLDTVNVSGELDYAYTPDGSGDFRLYTGMGWMGMVEYRPARFFEVYFRYNGWNVLLADGVDAEHAFALGANFWMLERVGLRVMVEKVIR